MQTTPIMLDALRALAGADDPSSVREALTAAREALGENVVGFGPLLELMRERAEEVSRLRRLAGSDELTGVHNRRSFRQLLRREVSRLERGGHGPAVLLLDLDGLKQINDTRGHATGDRAIVAAAQAIGTTLRAMDVVARIGGDEFAVLLPETSEAGARAVGERIRQAVEARNVDGCSLRISVGWAVADRMGIDADALIAFSDARLYADKSQRKPSLRAARAA